jgi:hypothetical protein
MLGLFDGEVLVLAGDKLGLFVGDTVGDAQSPAFAQASVQ